MSNRFFSEFSLPLFFFTFSLIFLHVSNAKSHKGRALIEETCKQYSESPGVPDGSQKFCLTTLESVKKSYKASFKGLGLISLELTKTNMTHVKAYVKKLLKDKKKFNKYAKMALKDCRDQYSDAIYNIKYAKMLFKKKDYGGANAYMSAVLDTPSDCEEGFSENSRAGGSPLTKQNDILNKLAGLAIWFTAVIR
ncbi:PREDICTED: putative invertase inhibitor [Nelumbo nucifera]|uniref:Putative invertase inhibitor n=2 Tax=Nelumbo nucifera TaxID=4432 RepID=A0A822XEB5_NELNU|nr:PREDICTED: putative invertase inhibitor [Nelumbo nucifera]DAD18232.1 TPA_asm: hypothetical protein HUJ06_019695 [Nelumbo nucifera]